MKSGVFKFWKLKALSHCSILDNLLHLVKILKAFVLKMEFKVNWNPHLGIYVL